MPEHRRVAHGIQTATPSHLSRIPKDSILKTRIPYPMIQRRKTMRQVASEQEAPVYLGHGCLPAQSKNRRGCRRTLDFLCIFCSLCFLRSYLHPRSKGKGERKDSSFPLYYTTWRRLGVMDFRSFLSPFHFRSKGSMRAIKILFISLGFLDGSRKSCHTQTRDM